MAVLLGPVPVSKCKASHARSGQSGDPRGETRRVRTHPGVRVT